MKKTMIVGITVLTLATALYRPLSVEADSSDDIKNVELMQTWIDFLENWINVIEQPSNAIGLAQSSLKDLYLENGKPERAIEALTEALDFVEDRGGRNAIRFTLAELYQEMGTPKKASDQFLEIIKENAKGNGLKVHKGAGKSVFE